MPFKSEAQRQKFASLVKSGKMSQQTFDEWEKDTPAEIPQRVRVKLDQPPKSVDDLNKIYQKRFGVK